MGTAAIVMVLTMAFYNILAIVVLQVSNHSVTRRERRQLVRAIASNPLLL